MRDIFEYNHQKQNFRLKNRFNWILSDNKKSLENLGKYHNKYRKEFYYISADKDLWYIKRKPTTTMSIIDKPSLVIMFAVMHRLSELSRYEPEKLFKHLNSLMKVERASLLS